MSDPLGLIGSVQPRGGPLPPVRPGAPQHGPSFREVLIQNLERVSELERDATRAVEDLAAGRRTDIESVLAATHKADTAFRALQAVRNKVMEAYEQIQQMRV
jgi:flagellar hook-basal body complex protein FliE